MVALHEEARQQWSTLMSTGRAAAATRLQARSLRNANDRAGSRCWTDAEIARGEKPLSYRYA
jgi:hypothetical protein